MTLKCWLGYHAPAIRDRAADGRRVLRCPECWQVCLYPATDVAALRAEQARQAAALAARKDWKRLAFTRGERT